MKDFGSRRIRVLRFYSCKGPHEYHERRAQKQDSGGWRITENERVPDVDRKTDRTPYLSLLQHKRDTRESHRDERFAEH